MKKIKEISLNEIKLNGYRPSHRNRWRLIECGLLSIQELSLLEFYADMLDFDVKHSEFGTFRVDFKVISKVFNKSSINTVTNWHNKLIKLGLVITTSKPKVFSLVNFERYVSPGPIWQGKAHEYAKQERNQNIELLLQNIGLKSQEIELKSQKFDDGHSNKTEISSTSSPIYLGSSKDESQLVGKVVVIKQDTRSIEEYKSIHRDMGDNSLSIDDMRWIDENVIEKIKIQSDEHANEIVDIFFDGDWNKFKQCLIT